MKNNHDCLPLKVQPTLRLTTRPNDANPNGDIFGGWLMSQIDIAGAIVAAARAKGPVVTVAVKSLQFIKPLFVHDVVSFYAQVVKIGNTSITVDIEVFSQRMSKKEIEVIKISYATFVYVAVTEPGHPRSVPKEGWL